MIISYIHILKGNKKYGTNIITQGIKRYYSTSFHIAEIEKYAIMH